MPPKGKEVSWMSYKLHSEARAHHRECGGAGTRHWQLRVIDQQSSSYSAVKLCPLEIKRSCFVFHTKTRPRATEPLNNILMSQTPTVHTNALEP